MNDNTQKKIIFALPISKITEDILDKYKLLQYIYNYTGQRKDNKPGFYTKWRCDNGNCGNRGITLAWKDKTIPPPGMKCLCGNSLTVEDFQDCNYWGLFTKKEVNKKKKYVLKGILTIKEEENEAKTSGV